MAIFGIFKKNGEPRDLNEAICHLSCHVTVLRFWILAKLSSMVNLLWTDATYGINASRIKLVEDINC